MTSRSRPLSSRALVALVAATLTGCGGQPQKPAPPPVSVTTAKITRGTIANYDTLDGQITPYLQSSLATQQAGTIVREFANEGDRVSAGEVLAKIDDSPLRAQLQEQEGSSVQAQAKLDQSRIQLPITNQQYRSAFEQAQQSLTQARQQVSGDRAAVRNARIAYDGNVQLFHQGFVSRTAFESARSTYVRAQSTLRQDLEKISQARSALAQADRNRLNTPLQGQVIVENRGAVTQASGQVALTQTQIGQTTLESPFDGVVTQRLLDPGAYAGPSAPLFVISQVDPIYVDFNVKQDDLRYTQPGALVTFATGDEPSRRYNAAVKSLNVVPTTGSLLYRARLVVRNPDDRLRGGMLVTVRITKALHRDVLLAPRGAVQVQGDKANLFLVRDGPQGGDASPSPSPAPSASPSLTAENVPVRLGLQNDTYFEVESPKLHEGADVVASRPDSLHDGTAVVVGH